MPPSQLSMDTLQTSTLSARSHTMDIYRKQMPPPSQSSTDTLQTGTPSARSHTMHIYRKQMDPPVN